LAHQTFHRAAGDNDVLPVERTPDLPGAIDAVVVLEYPADMGFELGVAPGPGARLSGLRRVVGGGGDLESLTDRLDPETVPMGIDVGDYFFGRRSSSAPKKTVMSIST
jgi:hypothetical protein